MSHLSHRVKSINPSPTLAITARAKALKAEGRDIINLGAGEPDSDTPSHIKQAAIDAINNGFTKYTAVDGTIELRQAIVDKFRNENQLDYELNQILVSCGGKQSFFNLAQAILNENDEVIIPAPYWVSYPDMVKLASAKPIIISAHQTQNFKITPAQLTQAITERTRLFVINSPSNPTGINYTRNELQALGEVLLRHPNIIIATDDMYEKILFNHQTFYNILNVCPQLYAQTIVMNGVSKAYSMTGWRIGYAAGNFEVIAAMKKVQSQSTSNPTSISQVAATAAITSGQECVSIMVAAFEERHAWLVDELNHIQGIYCLPSDGTFYCFPNVEQLLLNKGINSDLQLAERLLSDAGIAIIPGTAFGAPGYIRISFATSMGNLQQAIQKLKHFVLS